MKLKLKQLMDERGYSARQLAADLRVSRTALSRLINHALMPQRDQFATRLAAWLTSHGIDPREALKPALRANASQEPHPEDEPMLLRHARVSREARAHYGLSDDPFRDPDDSGSLFLTPDMRYVREAMHERTRHGGMVAVVGESGSGKSTLRNELVDRIQRNAEPVIVIEPYVLGMEADDKRGKTLRSMHIAEAVMAAVAPLQTLPSSPEARFRRVHHALRESSRSGHRHVLVIEEAHCLPLATLKHAKRWVELRDGMRPLLGVILLGQPELADRLSERNPEVREVVQRCEMVVLPPLDTALEGYLEHRFRAAGKPLGDVIEQGAVDAVRRRLTAGRGATSMVYPLAVHNVLAQAMNIGAALGVPRVTADLVGDAR